MKKILLSLTLISVAFTGSAQRYLGVSTGNWNALNSMYLNPAYLGGCNEKLAINLFSFNLGVDNNLGTISSLSDISNTTNSDGSNSIFKETGSGKFSMMVPSIEVRGPSILYRINSKHTLALSTRVRVFNEFNNFDRGLYSTINNPSAANPNINFSAQNFNWTAHLWSEVGLSYGGVAFDQGPFKVKVGATFRYLMGAGYMGVKGKNMDISYTSGSDSFRANNTDIEYASNVQSLDNGSSNGLSSSKIFGNSAGGKGFGTDLGAILVYKPNEDKDYTALVSLAITDIGFINYNTSYNASVTGNGYISGSDISKNVKSYDDLRAYALTKGYSVDTGTKATKVYLPTAMVGSIDFHAIKKFYINATFIANMAKDENFGSKYYSQITFTPRWDTKVFSFGLPITYNTLSHNMRLGMGLRLSGFFIGSDDMMANFSSNQYGYNVYVGGMIPIYRKSKSKQEGN